MVVPYAKGLSESFKNLCSKHWIHGHFKEGRNVKDALVAQIYYHPQKLGDLKIQESVSGLS